MERTPPTYSSRRREAAHGLRRRTILRQNSWRQVQALLHGRRPAAPDPEISHLQLRLPRLPAELEGIKIAHLSDIHYGLFLSSRSLSRILDLTQAQRPDLIAITGDFVTQSPAFVEPVCEMLARLRAPLGVWAVLGNHDFRSGAERLTRALRQQGIVVLRNQRRWIRHGAARFQIAGIDDSRQHPNVAAALGQSEPAAVRAPFRLLLAHNPVELESAARCGVDLVLSGHTHGGQVKLGFAAGLYERYLPAGLLTSGDTQMYVSRGLGKVIVPLRVGAPPELAFLDLRRTAAAS